MPAPRPPAGDNLAENAAPNLQRFIWLAAQLAALVLTTRLLNIEGGGAFSRLMVIVGVAFVVHYWLPFRWKEPFWVAVGLAGAFVLLAPLTAALLLALGALFYVILASSLSYRARIGIVLGLGAALIYGRATALPFVPFELWAVAGAVFMFRLAVYAYDLRFAKTIPTLREYLVFFFQLPNYYFVLYPVIDFKTMRRSYYRRRGDAIAQQGILWMTRGIVQLVLYRLVYQLKPSAVPEEVTSFPGLVVATVSIYLLYLRVSGQFHLVVGMMHLFGYDLPETHRQYLLADSLTDFWRRINIYWKDFMVKMVYFPLYFRWRKSGDVRAQVIATAGVFVATWALHSYQWFWLRGELLLSWPDTLFWAILGCLVIVNLLWERYRGTRAPVPGWRGRAIHASRVLATFTLIVTLWSLWNAPSLEEWFDLLTWWRIG